MELEIKISMKQVVLDKILFCVAWKNIFFCFQSCSAAIGELNKKIWFV